MSWGLASLLVLSGALAAGFAWYERSAPSARLLAVVGTLAALAILGRIAFAPIPNVKPTTDIVLIAGFVLGAAPGFAVGAVTALGSNLFFGQGPWTPWQMAAWGLIGIGGALLARLTRGRAPRIPLALACGLAGLLYGALLDLHHWTLAGTQSLEEYMTIAGLSLPFNLAHAVGNVVFFAAFGPALIRAVQRARTRFDIRWEVALPAIVAVIVLAAPEGTARAQSPADRGVAYLEQARNADGGWGGAPGEASNGLHTAWALYAMVAADKPVDAIDLLVRRLGSSTETGDILRTILALKASGGNPRDAGGRDLVAEVLERQRRNGSVAGYTSFTSAAVLALTAAGEPRGRDEAARWVVRQQNRDGGFPLFQRGGASSADDTGHALEALGLTGRKGTRSVREAVTFLRRAQARNGGYALSRNGPTNAQSTAFAVFGLVAAGVDPEKVVRHRRSPLDYLRRLQRPDGSFRYSASSEQTPVWVTAQAVLALKRRPLPLVPDGPVARSSAPFMALVWN